MTSDGLNGTLIIGTDNQVFRVEPGDIPLSPDDVNMPLELTIYGNRTLAPGIYEDKLTFIGYTGSTVSMGIKLKVNIDLYEPPSDTPQGTNIYTMLGIAGVIIITASTIYIKNKQSKEEENEAN